MLLGEPVDINGASRVLRDWISTIGHYALVDLSPLTERELTFVDHVLLLDDACCTGDLPRRWCAGDIVLDVTNDAFEGLLADAAAICDDTSGQLARPSARQRDRRHRRSHQALRAPADGVDDALIPQLVLLVHHPQG